MDHYDWMDRLFDHVHILQVQDHRSYHCGNRSGFDFLFWTVLEFLLCCVNDIQMLHTRKGILDEYKVLYYYSRRKTSNPGMVGRDHPNPCVQGIIARGINANPEIMLNGT